MSVFDDPLSPQGSSVLDEMLDTFVTNSEPALTTEDDSAELGAFLQELLVNTSPRSNFQQYDDIAAENLLESSGEGEYFAVAVAQAQTKAAVIVRPAKNPAEFRRKRSSSEASDVPGQAQVQRQNIAAAIFMRAPPKPTLDSVTDVVRLPSFEPGRPTPERPYARARSTSNPAPIRNVTSPSSSSSSPSAATAISTMRRDSTGSASLTPSTPRSKQQASPRRKKASSPNKPVSASTGWQSQPPTSASIHPFPPMAETSIPRPDAHFRPSSRLDAFPSLPEDQDASHSILSGTSASYVPYRGMF
jgi:hypothetical protein